MVSAVHTPREFSDRTLESTMKRVRTARIGLGLLAILGMVSTAVADGRSPGSLLLYPEFDNRAGVATVLTVTNTSTTEDVSFHIVYRGRYAPNYVDLNCLEFDRDYDLTPNDTLTLITKNDNPNQEQGYAYAYAQNSAEEAIVFNHLIGHLLSVDGIETLEYAVNPFMFDGIGDEGDLTDADLDGVRDLNGTEYEYAADELLIPRFIAQNDRFRGRLILIGLSGGSEFNTTASFWIYNDNEEPLSAQYTFRCWAKERLKNVSDAFKNDWIRDNTTHDLNEELGTDQEYGWFRITGGVASAGACSIIDAVVYGVFVEILNGTAAADLPFEIGENDGHLLPQLLTGDNEEDCGF
jgi:hypothetical protein